MVVGRGRWAETLLYFVDARIERFDDAPHGRFGGSDEADVDGSLCTVAGKEVGEGDEGREQTDGESSKNGGLEAQETTRALSAGTARRVEAAAKRPQTAVRMSMTLAGGDVRDVVGNEGCEAWRKDSEGSCMHRAGGGQRSIERSAEQITSAVRAPSSNAL